MKKKNIFTIAIVLAAIIGIILCVTLIGAKPNTDTSKPTDTVSAVTAEPTGVPGTTET